MSEIVAIFMAICAYYGHKLAKKHSDASCYTPPVFLGLKYRQLLSGPSKKEAEDGRAARTAARDQ